jgi:copper(I)-binding protein
MIGTRARRAPADKAFEVFRVFRPLPLLTLGAVLATPALADPLTLEDAWVRALPPTQSVTAGYLTVTNSGNDTVRIVGAEAGGAGRTELHESRAEGSAMRMVAVEALPLAPGESARFAPGGLHMMLKDLERMPAPGDSVRLCLLTDDGGRSCTDAAVRRAAPAGGHQHHEH